MHEWNKKWLILQRRKSDLQDSYEMRIPIGIIAIPEKDNLFKRILRSLADAESEQAVGDCEAQFNLHFPTVEVDMVDRGFKRPKCRSSYSCAHDAGLGSITKYFGLTSEAFGDNLKAGHKVNIDVLLLVLQGFVGAAQMSTIRPVGLTIWALLVLSISQHLATLAVVTLYRTIDCVPVKKYGLVCETIQPHVKGRPRN